MLIFCSRQKAAATQHHPLNTATTQRNHIQTKSHSFTKKARKTNQTKAYTEILKHVARTAF